MAWGGAGGIIHMKRKKWLIAGGILVALVLAGIMAARRQTGMPVQAAEAARQDLQAKVSANGKIQAVKKVDITASSIGQVTRMLVQEGDAVRPGQLLLEIDPVQSRAAAQSREANLKATSHDLAAAEAKLDQTRKNFVRAELNRKAQIISESDYEQARTNLDMDAAAARSARQHVDQARADLAGAADVLVKTRVTSPMSGMVTGKHIELGETAVPGLQNQPGTVLLTISDMSLVEAEMEVDEASIPMVQLGQAAQARIDAYPNQVFDGKVTEVGGSPIVQANTNEAIKFKVKIQLAQPPAGVKPGLSTQADIFTGSRTQVLAVPIQALVMKGVPQPGQGPREQEGVFLIERGRAVFRPLKTGLMGDLTVEVLSGLQGGEQVIVGPFKALRELRDGDPVRPEARKK
jgi:HlyD family secretion protein